MGEHLEKTPEEGGAEAEDIRAPEIKPGDEVIVEKEGRWEAGWKAMAFLENGRVLLIREAGDKTERSFVTPDQISRPPRMEDFSAGDEAEIIEDSGEITHGWRFVGGGATGDTAIFERKEKDGTIRRGASLARVRPVKEK